MLVVISPAKRLDWSAHVPPGAAEPTDPAMADQAAVLAAVARGLSSADLKRLMGISDALADLNRERFAEFAAEPDAGRTRPAVFAFAGDTYAGLDARSLDADSLRWSQGHLRILSGLYGLLRPLDRIQPYRLEMGSRLANPRGKSLYAFWGDRLARALNDLGAQARTEVLVNCASEEYFAAVDRDRLSLEVITPRFLEDRPEGPRIVSFHAKKARGAMARFMMERRLDTPEALKDFDSGGYRFVPELSQPGAPAFLRSAP